MYASLEYRFHFGDTEGLYARITDDFKSANTGPYLYQESAAPTYDPDLKPGPSSNQVDMRLGRKWSGFDISLFVDNVLDAAPRFVNPQASHYVGYLDPTNAASAAAAPSVCHNYDAANSPGSCGSPIYSYTSLRPRTIGITATFNF